MLIKYCDRIIISCLLLLVFIMPLFFGLNINSLGIQKISAMRVLSLIILCSWLIKVVWKRELNWVRTPLDLPVLSIVLISILATIFSINRWISLFGYYGHHEGLLVILNYIFIFYCLVNFITTKKLFLKTINVVVMSGLCTAIYGIMQYFKLDPVKWELDFGRVPSSLGNPIGFGNYAAMTILLCVGLYFAYKEKKIEKPALLHQQKKKKKRKDETYSQISQLPSWQIPKWIYGIILGITYVGFSYSNSRAPFLGLLGGLFLVGLLVGKRVWLERRRVLAIILGIFVVLTIYFALALPQSIFNRLKITIFSLVAQTQDISADKKTPTNPETILKEGRIYIWEGALRIIKDYPVLGTGLDTLGIIYPRYKLIESVFGEGAYATAASAHNELLDIATSRGLLGITAYFWLLIAFILMCWKIYAFTSGRDAVLEQDENRYLISGLVGAFCTYLIQSQFSPTDIVSSLLFWTIMGLGCVQYTLFKSKIHTYKLFSHQDTGLQWVITLGGIAVSVWLFILLVIRPCIADFNYEQGTLLTASKGQTDNDTIYRFEQAVRFNPYETQYRRDVCVAYLEKAKSLSPVLIKKAINEANALIKINSYDTVGYSVLGAAYYLEGKELNKAVNIYLKAIEVDPYNPDSHHILGLVYQKQGNTEKAAKEFREALKLNPDYEFVWNNLIALYSNMNRPDELENVLKGLINESYGPRTILFQHKLIEFYLQKARFNEAKELCKSILKLDPNNEKGYEILGNIYYQQQQFKDAKFHFQKLTQISPTNTYAIEMLEVLKDVK